MTNQDRFEAGMTMRRRVLGDAHVDRSLANASEFTRPIQELVTEYCWGDVWTRPGLAPRDRSLLNLGMLTALNRNEELGLHVRGALNNGLSTGEIQEALLQAAIYCGVPAALSAFRVAKTVIEEVEAERGPNGADPAPSEDLS
jgi:4-carboxymuconolactone decarboxylase